MPPRPRVSIHPLPRRDISVRTRRPLPTSHLKPTSATRRSEPDVAPIVEKNFQIVHVDIGDDGKKNDDLVQEYKIPLDKGVPALAILAPDGKLLYSQQNGEWESARSLDPDDVVAFLNKWKP